MKQMTQSEFNGIKGVIQAHGHLTVEQALGVAKARSCPRCGGKLMIDGDDDDDAFRPASRLMCLQGGHELAEVRHRAD